MDTIRNARIRIGVDPLGGAGVHYWEPIAEKYRLDLTVVNKIVDPAFSFMTVDWDGQIRMDPSSTYAMQRLIAIQCLLIRHDVDSNGVINIQQQKINREIPRFLHVGLHLAKRNYHKMYKSLAILKITYL